MDPGLDPAAYSYVHELRVRFAETDAMGVVHHAAYLPYLEEARVAYLRAMGRPYAEIRACGTDIAVVEVHVRYRVALRFDDVVKVHVRLGAPSASTFQIAYLLAVGGVAAATAVTMHACVDATTGRPRRLDGWLAELPPERERALSRVARRRRERGSLAAMSGLRDTAGVPAERGGRRAAAC